MSHRLRKIAVRVVALPALLASALGVSNAYAATPAGWGGWLMPTGRICVQTGTQTWLPAAAATAAWDKSDASMVAKVSCAGYSRSMTVIVRSYSRPDKECAYTGSPGWSWQKVRGVWSWVPTAPTISVNQYYRAICQGTYRKRLNLMSHELGHVLGLAHATGITVMQPAVNETYVLPTSYDIARVNRRY